MAELEFDPPSKAPAAGGERTLEFDAPNREQEIRHETLKKLLMSGEPGYTTRAGDQVTMGLMGPLQGLMTAAGGSFGSGPPSSFGERYRGGVGAQEDYVQRARDNTKGPLGTAADVAGSIVGGGTSTAATSVPKLMGQAAVMGGVEGAARNAEDPANAAKGAAGGAAIGAGTAGIVGGLLDRLGRVTNAKRDLGVASRQGGAQSLQEEGGAIYKRLDDAGIHYSPKETAPLTANVTQALAAEGFNPNMHHELLPALGEIAGASGQRTTWSQLQNMRTQISDLKASNDPRLRRVAGTAGDELDSFIRTAKPTMPAASVAAGINPAADVEAARDLWRRGSQAGKVEGLAEIGTRSASDPAAKVSKNFESYTDSFKRNPDKYNPFGSNPEQMKLMDQIVAGSPRTSAAAKGLDRWGNNLVGYGGVGTAAGLGLPFLFNDEHGTGGMSTSAGLGAMGLGMLAKGGASGLRGIAARNSAEQINDLLRNIVTGQTAPQAGAHVPRQLLAKLLAARDPARGLGNYASSFVDTGGPQP